MLFDNPFRENRLNNSQNFRPEWDVPELNRVTSNWLVAEVGRLRGRKEPDPGQMIAVMLGPPGYGKTHLFGRIEHLVGHEVFFAFIPAFEAEAAPLDHIRRYVVQALFRTPAGGRSLLEIALATTCRPAFADFFEDLPPTLAARHEPLIRRLEEDSEAVLEIIRKVDTLTPFMKLADSLASALPDQDAGTVRALALGWAPEPWSTTARRWLQGQDLPETELVILGLGEEPPTPLDVLRAIPAILGHDRPMMVCCDQIESVIQGEDTARLNLVTTSIMDLLQSLPAQIVLSCLKDRWIEVVKLSFRSFNMRVRQPAFELSDLRPDQAIQMVKSRLASWSGAKPDSPPCWPFEEASISELVREERPTPRALIQKCDAEFAKWIEEGSIKTIKLGLGDVPQSDLTYLFLQEWNREIEEIRKNPERSAENLAEARLYRGIFEALRMAESARRLRDFGGVRIAEVQDRAIKSTAATPRPGARVVIAVGMGQVAPSAIVALTTMDNSRKFTGYLRALSDAMADPVSGAVLIHPKRDITMSPGARADYEAAIRAGKIRLFPLEDYPQTHAAAECLATMLDRANARELVLGDTTLSVEDCREMVIKTGVIDNLDLFKMLGHWRKPAERATTGAKPEAPRAEATGPKPGGEQPSASAVPPGPEAAPKPGAAGPGAATGPPRVDLEEWAASKLVGAIKKLKLFGHQVEPDGFEIGPTFARLRIRPIGKTNFKGVANTAVDLRISLGLEVVPIVGSQAGSISIDIQRPDRAVVTLAEALAAAPMGLDGRPAFPVGVDVRGQAHWLNLADPSDCHLLVAGTTGSGKSEFLRAMLASLAVRLGPDRLQFFLIDPKRVTFNLDGTSPYLRSPVAYGLEEALPLVEACMTEMDRRYAILGERKLSNVSELPPDLLPRIVLVIDEFASFMEDKESKKVATNLLKRIGAMARAAGIHLVLSTQRPDKDVITPLLRENLPGRIALKVSSKAGSDLILGSTDAENLLGKGDLFWKKGGDLLRLQSPFVSQGELERVLKVKS